MICLQITDLEEQIQVMRNEIRKQNEIVGELEKSIFKKRFCTARDVGLTVEMAKSWTVCKGVYGKGKRGLAPLTNF